jgi:glucokinase
VLTIGIDVGGTKVLGVAIDTEAPGAVLAEQRVLTPEGGAGLVDAVAELIVQIDAEVGAPAALGVGVPGLVDRTGVLHMGPHLRHIAEVALASLLRTRTGLPTVVDNDANCHAVAEHRGGAAQGADEALVVTFGTGIGAGIITGGALLHGANGFAGEPGHMIVDPHGPPCPCGQHGCWEQFASGTGLARLARDAAHGGRLDAVVAGAGGDPDAVRGEHVTAAARSGDADARAVLADLAHWIALGLANLVNILDPAVVVIGGGLVDAADLILPEVRTRFAGLVMAADQRPELPIVAAALGGRAGAIGAAVLAGDQRVVR